MSPDIVERVVWELLFGAREKKKVVVSFQILSFLSPSYIRMGKHMMKKRNSRAAAAKQFEGGMIHPITSNKQSWVN